MSDKEKLNTIHECTAATLNELPHYPCELKEMTDRELKIVEICSMLCGAMAWIEKFSECNIKQD